MIMPKFNPKQIQIYAQTLQDVLENAENAAERVAPYFTKLRDAIDANTVADMPAAEFAEIKSEFDDAVAVYADNAAKLAAAQAPIRAIGVHKSLTANYQAYFEATKAMADAVKIDGQSVDMVPFEKSEDDQEVLSGKINTNVTKLLMSLR